MFVFWYSLILSSGGHALGYFSNMHSKHLHIPFPILHLVFCSIRITEMALVCYRLRNDNGAIGTTGELWSGRALQVCGCIWGPVKLGCAVKPQEVD